MDQVRWSRLIRLRDRGMCVVCGGKFDIWKLHAHHIRPRSIYPYSEDRLNNGVTLCAGCHMGAVHRYNAFIDCSDDESNRGWRMFQPMFERYVGLSQQRKFNIKNQK